MERLEPRGEILGERGEIPDRRARHRLALDPPVHRPAERIPRVRLPGRELLGNGERQSRRHLREPASLDVDRLLAVAYERQTHRRRRPETEDGIRRAVRRDALDRQPGPLRMLQRDQPLHERSIDDGLVGMKAASGQRGGSFRAVVCAR